MATAQELETALINADKAGDKDAAVALATELKRVRTAPVTPYKTGDLKSSIEQVSHEFSDPSKFAIGASGWINSAAMRLKQLLGRELTPEDLQGIKEYSALKESSGAATAGDIAMNLLATLNPAAKAQQAGAQVLGKVLPKALAGPASTGLTAAAITAASEPVTEGQTTAGEAGKSAAVATAADVATRGLARAAQPIIQSEAVKKLTKEGIVPTIGQAAGGFINRVEQQLESVPIIGSLFISSSRGRAVKELDEAAIRKALPAGTAEEIKAGREGVERAGEILDGAYDRVYGTLKGRYSADKPFQNALDAIPNKEGIDLTPDLKDRFDRLIKDRVLSKLENAGTGGATAEQVRQANNSLGALARKYRGSGDPDQRSLGAAFSEAKAELRESITRQSSGDFKTALQDLDKKYSALIAVEKASGYQGSKEGIFSADALKRASEKSTPEMRQFAETGSDVLGRTVPDSGTAGRAMVPLVPYILGGAAGGNEAIGGPGWVSGALAAPLLYSRAGSRYLTGGYGFQSLLSQTLRDLAPYAGQVGRASE